MEAELKANLVALKDAYCSKADAAPASVAQAACGDWRFFDRIENGSSFTARIYDRAVHWFDERWPDGAEWPSDVPRPSETRGAA